MELFTKLEPPIYKLLAFCVLSVVETKRTSFETPHLEAEF